MISQAHDGNLITYEQTLRYAEFPALDILAQEREIFKDSCALQFQHTELFRVLKWLRYKMKVKTIIKLKVSDRLVNSHDERTMAEAVRLFNVEVLDWKVLDLCITVFDDTSKKRLRELHLYSSGKRAVISHWFSAEGFKVLKNASSPHFPLQLLPLTYYCSSKFSRSISFRFSFPFSPFQVCTG